MSEEACALNRPVVVFGLAPVKPTYRLPPAHVPRSRGTPSPLRPARLYRHRRGRLPRPAMLGRRSFLVHLDGRCRPAHPGRTRRRHSCGSPHLVPPASEVSAAVGYSSTSHPATRPHVPPSALIIHAEACLSRGGRIKPGSFDGPIDSRSRVDELPRLHAGAVSRSNSDAPPVALVTPLTRHEAGRRS